MGVVDITRISYTFLVDMMAIDILGLELGQINRISQDVIRVTWGF